MDIFLPVQLLADYLVYGLIKLETDSYLGRAINFFIYDAVKIGILLVVVNYLMAAVRYHLPTEKIREILIKKRWYGLDYLLAAFLGMATPFCSCSSIPIFIGFITSGIPLGITLTFLISSPLINETSLFFFPSIFGWKVTVIYNFIGIAVSVIGGMVIQKLDVEKYIRPEYLNLKARSQPASRLISEPLQKRLKLFWNEGIVITKKIFPYVIIGISAGALIHGYLPQSIIEGYLSQKSWWTIPATALLGAPFYANSMSVIPLVEALVKKGFPMGTVLTFMSSVVTLSLPEVIMLNQVMKWQLLALFLLITLTGIIVSGYLLNWMP